MALYKNKYRIESARLQTWDYRWNAAYFITICTKNKEHFFGEIIRGDNENEMKFSDTGKSAWNFWEDIPTHFPFVKTDAFTVMPNHIHGILIINNNPHVETLHCNVSDTQHNVSDTQHNLSDIQHNDPDTGNIHVPEIKTKNESMAVIAPKKGSISTIVRSYKSAVSKHAHSLIPYFAWQERFHDHVIRTEEEFNKIQNYILTNPQNWKEDMFYK